MAKCSAGCHQSLPMEPMRISRGSDYSAGLESRGPSSLGVRNTTKEAQNDSAVSPTSEMLRLDDSFYPSRMSSRTFDFEADKECVRLPGLLLSEREV